MERWEDIMNLIPPRNWLDDTSLFESSYVSEIAVSASYVVERKQPQPNSLMRAFAEPNLEV